MDKKKGAQLLLCSLCISSAFGLFADVLKGNTLSFHQDADAVEVLIKDRVSSGPIIELLVAGSVGAGLLNRQTLY